jgi:hypothetical protein
MFMLTALLAMAGNAIHDTVTITTESTSPREDDN